MHLCKEGDAPVNARRQATIVFIPTINRPGELKITLGSVLEQAQRYKHTGVHIVVSDYSFDATAKQRNARVISKFSRAFPAFPLHYYPSDRQSLINEVLQDASEEERNAYRALVPRDGHWGAHLNRLTLLSAYHGGKKARYVQLDDDTPFYLVDKQGKLTENPSDIFSQLHKGLRHAIAKHKKGYVGKIVGVVDASASGEYHEPRT